MTTNRLTLPSTQPTESIPSIESTPSIPSAPAESPEPLSPHHLEAITWATDYCNKKKLSYADLGQLLRQPGTAKPYSGDSVYAAMTGRRDEGSLDRFTQAIETFRRQVEETAPKSINFIATSLSDKITALCDNARRRHKITFLFGPMQTGKTEALAHYAEHHGDAVMVRMPTRGMFADFLAELAKGLNIAGIRQSELRRAIIERFTPDSLLIVDECHQSLGQSRSMASLEFCREIWDRRRCGMLLCGTNDFRMALVSHRVLRQLWLRGYRPFAVTPAIARHNIDDFARAFKLQPAPDQEAKIVVSTEGEPDQTITDNPRKLQDTVLAQYGLGRWISILEDAAELATDAGARMTWSRVITAARQWQNLETA